MNNPVVRRSLDINNAKDLGAHERKPQPKTAEPLIPTGSYDETRGWCRHFYRDDNGKMAHGDKVREWCPSQDYRHLLSPETRQQLEERGR